MRKSPSGEPERLLYYLPRAVSRRLYDWDRFLGRMFHRALGLAVRMNGLTAQEALIAGTANSACALGLTDVGRIEAGLRADFLILKSQDWRQIVYEMGTNPVSEIWAGGERVMA